MGDVFHPRSVALHSTMFAEVASQRTDNWQSASEADRLKLEDLMILPRTINLSPTTTTTTTKPGQRIIRCLSHAVSVNNVFHMYSCWCEHARVTAVLKRVHIQRGPLTRGRGVRHELICRSLWWGRRLLFFRFRRRKRARRTCGCHQKDFFLFFKNHHTRTSQTQHREGFSWSA